MKKFSIEDDVIKPFEILDGIKKSFDINDFAPNGVFVDPEFIFDSFLLTEDDLFLITEKNEKIIIK